MTTQNNLHKMELTDREVRTIGEKRWLYKHRTSVMMGLFVTIIIYAILTYASYEWKLKIPVWGLYLLVFIFLAAIARYIFGSEAAGKAFLEWLYKQEKENK